jgi:SAM-dependent methyltransferase
MEPKPRFLGSDYAAQFQDPAVAAVYRKRPPYPAETFGLIHSLLPARGGRVLDVGSGTGDIAIPLAVGSNSLTVDALDPSAAMLAVARSQPGSERVRWHTETAESFAYPDPYDLIICAQSLGWLQWETVFPKFSSALADGGWLVIVTQQALDGLPWQEPLTALIARFSTNQDFEPFSLMAGLIARGLFRPRAYRRTAPVPFEQSIEDFIDSIHARNGFSRDRMPGASAREFDRSVHELLSGYHPDGIVRGDCTATIHWGTPGA